MAFPDLGIREIAGRHWRERISGVATALFALAAVSLAGYFLDAGRYATAGPAPQTVTKDAAITAIVNPAPPFATAGAVLTISVTAQNLGNRTETLAVKLVDTTDDNRQINRVSLTLAANEKGVILFLWDTATASAGVHILRATATLAGDTNAANNSLTNAPGLLILARPRPAITIDDFDVPDAHYGQGITMARPALATPAEPLTAVFTSPAQAALTGTLSPPAMATVGQPRQELFIGGAVVSYSPRRIFLNPFRRGEVRGRVRLQSRDDSWGGYVQVGDEVYFLEADGRFRAAIPSGVQDIYIRAPGYVPVLIPRARINPGELLTIPELTLPFGDANGDGRVDILDLSIAAGNFGDTIRRLPPP